jgi:hypothetical protein
VRYTPSVANALLGFVEEQQTANATAALQRVRDPGHPSAWPDSRVWRQFFLDGTFSADEVALLQRGSPVFETLLSSYVDGYARPVLPFSPVRGCSLSLFLCLSVSS